MSSIRSKHLQQQLERACGSASREGHSLCQGVKNKIGFTFWKDIQHPNTQGKATRNTVAQPPHHPAICSLRLPCLVSWYHHLPPAEEEKDPLKASEEDPALWTPAQSSPPLPRVWPVTPQFLNRPQGTAFFDDV